MRKLRLLSVGKTKETWLLEAFDEYKKRLSPIIDVLEKWVKNDQELLAEASKETHIICLDPLGKTMDSETFSSFLFKSFDEGGARLCLIIGGANGLPEDLKKKKRISLSPMTMTHQITRLVLLEQIYRAAEIHKGSQYHK